MINVIDLQKKFEKRIILKNINLTLEKGEVHVIYGKNGAGKSTLLKCICGLLKLDSGEIKIENVDIKEIGLVLDNSLLIQKLKVIEYLQFIGELKKIDRNTYLKRIDNVLKDLSFENERNTLTQNLSKGTKSKLALAASLIFDPEVMILDEPFSGMDLTTIDQATKLIRSCAEKGSIVLISTHQAELLPSFTNKVSILKEGVILETLNSETIQERIKSDNKSSFSEYLKGQI